MLIGHSSPVLCVTEDLPPGRMLPSDLWPPHPGDTTALPTSPQYPRVLAAIPVSARNSLKDLEADKDARISEICKSIEQQGAEKALVALNDARIQELEINEMRKSIELLEAQKTLVFLKDAKIQERQDLVRGNRRRRKRRRSSSARCSQFTAESTSGRS